MKDYEVTVKIRNNYLMTVMRQRGCDGLSELSRRSGVTLASVYNIANLKMTIYNKRGDVRKPVRDLAKYLRVPVDAIIPPQHADKALEKSQASFEASLPEIATILEAPSMDAAIEHREMADAIEGALSEFPERTAYIVRERFGLNDDRETKTLLDLGEELGVSSSRVRQIEEKALEMLKNPKMSSKLRPHIDS